MSKKFTLFFFLCLTALSFEIIVEINNDFNFDIEYRLEKQETSWSKRGQLSFRKKDPINYKSTASLLNFNFTPEMKKEIQKECKLEGTYILQFTNEKQKNETFYSSVNACLLINSNYHDKLIINSHFPIESNEIKSLNYLADPDYDDSSDEDDDDDEEDEDIVKNKKGGNNKKKELTKIEIAKVKNIEGPYFSEEDEGLDENSKKKKIAKDAPPQSFLGKYWWIIALVMFMAMMGGGKEEAAAGQQEGGGQAQGQAN